MLLSNSATDLAANLEAAFLREIISEAPSAPPSPASFKLDVNRYTGVYEALGMRHEVSAQGEVLRVRVIDKLLGSDEEMATLLPYSPDVFDVQPDNGWPSKNVLLTGKISFLEQEEDGKARFSRSGVRLLKRISV